jgi:thymidylate synthase ThyX
MNLRAMLNIIAQRGVEAADEEIQDLAKEFLKIGMKVAPSYFKHVKLDERGRVLNPRELKI